MHIKTNNNFRIKSFVRRSGRLTKGQQKGITDLWNNYVIEGDELINFNQVFNNNNKVVLEIGFGNGDSLIQTAMQKPDNNYLGIDVYKKGIARLINNINKNQLTNLKIIEGDAVLVLENNIKNNSLKKVQLFFPDPWHKKKHHKRRLIQTKFLDLLSTKIINNGIIHIATDWENYAKEMIAILENHPHFKNTVGSTIYNKEINRPITKFEKRGKLLGHKIWDLIFINDK
jgi:tRNA (guanine-N7-)-methyltransferase